MKRALLSLLSFALFASHLAYADTYTTFYITDGTFASGGTFSGSFVLDTSTDDITGATILVDADGFDGTLASSDNLGLSQFDLVNGPGGDASADFYLVINSSTTDPSLCVGSCRLYGTGTVVTLNDAIIVDPATGGVVSATPPAATPEPSSLILLGTGGLALLGAARRRLGWA